MKDKNDMIDLKEERDFEALLRSALLETTREELRADEDRLRDADIPPVPESLMSRINVLIAEDTGSRTMSQGTENEGAGAGISGDTVSGPRGSSEDRPGDERKGSIISLAGRRLRSRSLASAAATVILAGAAIYGAGSVLQGGVGVSGSTAMVAEMAEGAAEETAAARELEAMPETAAAAADAAPAPAALQESPESAGTFKMRTADTEEAEIGVAPEAAANAQADAGPVAASVANPMQEVAAPSDIEDELGVIMEAPEDAEDLRCYVISGKIGQLSYSLSDGTVCTYRGAADVSEDISGVYYDIYEEETVDVDGIEVELGFADISEDVRAALLRWEQDGCSYSLFMEGCSDRDAALSEAEELIRIR